MAEEQPAKVQHIWYSAGIYMIKETPLWVTIATFLIALIGIRTGCVANNTAKESTEIARTALEQSKEALAVEQRPYLHVKPVKFKETDSYLRVSNPQKSAVVIESKYELHNAGRSPAARFSLPRAIASSRLIKEGAKVELIVPPEMTLGPGETQYMVVKLGFNVYSPSPQEFVKSIENGEEEVIVRLPITYFDMQGTEYKTLKEFKIGLDDAAPLASEMR